MKNDREWQIGIFGTFDVANYGDLLFPIIAEEELTNRLGAVKFHRFSYHARTPPQWPYEVISLSELPELADSLDAVLIGGGFIIRFDKFIAPDYGPPNPSIHHPTGYWLSPALIALQHGIPLIWNAPGMHCNEVPEWAVPLVKLMLEHSPHIKVRDALSQSILAPLSNRAQIDVLPDTAFGLSRLLNDKQPSAEFLELRKNVGLTNPYLIVQATAGLDSFLQLWRTHSSQFQKLQIVLLPIGPVLGDHESILGDDLPRSIRLPFWPQPKLLAELICHAEGVVGQSYHLAVSALAFGVPVFCSADLGCGKYTALPVYERIFQLSWDIKIDPQWLISKLGKRPISAAASHALNQLDAHWDQVAEIIRKGARPTKPALNRYWQSLPGYLEAAQDRCQTPEVGISPAQAVAAEHRASSMAEVTELSNALMRSNEHIAALYESNSFKLTAPMRIIRRYLRQLLGK